MFTFIELRVWLFCLFRCLLFFHQFTNMASSKFTNVLCFNWYVFSTESHCLRTINSYLKTKTALHKDI